MLLGRITLLYKNRSRFEPGIHKILLLSIFCTILSELAFTFYVSGLLPICASCKNIRDDKGYWNQIESYLQKHSDAEFSHGICPDCMEKLYGDQDWYKKRYKK